VPATLALAKATGAKVYSYGPHPTPEGVTAEQEGDFSFAPDVKLNDGDVIQGDGWNVEAVHTPGHISNHLCFAVKEDKALLSGDHVMGWSTAVISPPDGNMADYFASLRKLLPRDESLYIPTHGAEIRDPNPFVRAYIDHRLGREAQIIARLKDGPQTIPQMVARNYADTPVHLHPAAGRSMLAHLVQMVKDGRVKTEDGRAAIDSVYRL
jgi:glyoxylase-like metal-dependent hydrolase (beta-lactamase superfamily II)